ncbi:MAG TPA: hypothetical protein VGO81_02780 [Solirubrobacteraceae bacterium]|jgi:outer membrane murein-binding lipoprotein Lpp|nr:hypothetical protein [Solirubrobacteraceae bacterium]
MAKKKSASRADAVREAAEQAFRAQIPRERISELLDELGNTAGRLRGAVDELRPASEAELKSLRAEVRSLAARVEALEAKPEPRRKPRAAAKPAAAKPRKPRAAAPPDAAS